MCTSLNRGNKGCEDAFNNTGEYYRSDCQASREGRIGMFPATQCIKMVAEDSKHKINATKKKIIIIIPKHIGIILLVVFGEFRSFACVNVFLS